MWFVNLYRLTCHLAKYNSPILLLLILVILSNDNFMRFVSCDGNTNTGTAKTSKTPTPAPRIAIIGAGMGGSSAAYHLHQLLDGNVQTVVFDEKPVIGGRAATVTVFGNDYETGGSVIHPKNKLAVDLAKELGLRQKRDRPGGIISLVNKDSEYVWGTSGWTLITLWKVFERYGFDFNRLKRMTGNFIDEFQTIYKLQDNGESYETVDKMLKSMSPNLFNLTRSDFRTFLLDNGLDERFVDEMVQAITYVNYGQTAHIHSLVGSVSVAGAADGLWSVECGNKHLPIALLNHTKTRVELNTKIQSIIQLPDGSLKLSTDSEGKAILAGNFDKVIIAAPFMSSTKKQIKLINFPAELGDLSNFAVKYHRTVATIIAAKGVNPKYKSWLDMISIEPNYFTSLSRIYPVLLIKAELMPVYKVFSPEPLTEEQLNELFEDIKFKHVADWLAYPEYDQIPPKLDTFILNPKIYHLNSIEMAASAMEMSLISGRNAAIHLVSQLKKLLQATGSQKQSKTKEEL